VRVSRNLSCNRIEKITMASKSRMEKSLSPYELQRLANIKRNKMLMESL
jgi:hypothetical protein